MVQNLLIDWKGKKKIIKAQKIDTSIKERQSLFQFLEETLAVNASNKKYDHQKLKL